MEHLVGDLTGVIHLVASILALVFGTLILLMTKGTKTHKQIGYAYLISMLILIITALMIYRLFKTWGIFHYLAVLSTVTILLGMFPIWLKKPVKTWQYLHFSFMYWSVMGLYAAFAGEVLTRVPETPFFQMVGISIGVIMMIGGIVFGIKQKKWSKIYGNTKNTIRNNGE